MIKSRHIKTPQLKISYIEIPIILAYATACFSLLKLHFHWIYYSILVSGIGKSYTSLGTSSKSIEQLILDTNAGKQLSQVATDVLLTLVLKKMNNI